MDATQLDLERYEQDLRAARVEIVVGSVIDFAGVARAKTVPLERLSSFATAGMGASPSWNVFCIDDSIAFTEKLGVVGDLRLHIDPAALRVVAPGVAWAPGEFTEQDGTPSPLNTRGLLRRVSADLAADGYQALVGCELEFALLPADGSFEGPWQAYGLGAVMGEAERGFIRALVASAAAVGLPLEQVHAEYGRRQVEISLGPTDPVRAADNVVLARLLIGRAAEALGLRASFSPLASVEANAANGAHVHFSFTDARGVPVFSGGEGPHGITEAGGSAIAGVLRRLPEFLGFYAGSVLSSHRLLPGHWSGAHLCWGLENREAAVRFCAATTGNPSGASAELKVVDPSANPYLAVAATLWSAHEGIRDGLALPAEVGRPPSAHGGAVEVLVPEQGAVLEALAASAAALAFAGPEAMEALLAVRGHEVRTYADTSAHDLAERFRFTWSV
ncbi:MAG: glutamine synthetase family protein [Trebonia sp.]|jgi:glutamine synthetase